MIVCDRCACHGASRRRIATAEVVSNNIIIDRTVDLCDDCYREFQAVCKRVMFDYFGSEKNLTTNNQEN